MADAHATYRTVGAQKMIEDSRGSAYLRVSNCVHLAAAPTFAIMALLTAVVSDSADMLCSAAHDASPLTGMVAMYVLMSIFHSLPWLKLISSWRNPHARGRSYA